MKKRMLVLLALAGVIAGFVATSSSARIVDNGGCRVYHIRHVIYDASCDG